MRRGKPLGELLEELERSDSRPRVVVGLDLSLAGAAACALPNRWQPGDWSSVRWKRFGEEGKLSAEERIEKIVKGVVSFAAEHKATHVAVEQHAFGRAAQKGTFARAELVGAVKHEVWLSARLRVFPIVASHARKVLFGRAPNMPSEMWKQTIEEQMRRMGSPIDDHDSRDAFVVANCFLHEMGIPCLAAG